MPTDLIAEIRTARALLRDEEVRTHGAAIELQNCRQREKKAKVELDRLLDELETGESRYTLPGFDRLEVSDSGGNGQHTPLAAAGEAPILRVKGRKAKPQP